MRPEPAALFVVAALCAAGCTPMQWVKPDATAEQLQEDSTRCHQDAWREAQLNSWYYRPFSPFAMRDPFGRPFVAWPYRPYADPFGNAYLEEARLAQFCMRNKGYELEPVEKPKGQVEKPKGQGEPKG
jgi:hypothetical protein